MKIRLVSIEGKIADPLYNLEQMAKEIKKATEDKINLLIFPINSLSSTSLNDVRNNHKYQEQLSIAKSKLMGIIEETSSKNSLRIYFDQDFDMGRYMFNNNSFIIYNFARFESLEELNGIEEFAKKESIKNEDRYIIICHGRGTESVSQGVYSNTKIIAYNGKVLASNVDTDANVVDLDTTPTLSKYPYLDKIENKERLFPDILNLQGVGLYNKMKSMNRFKICLGISGGLDSTVSLLACVEAFKKYNLPLKNIIGVTMPGLGTTDRTYKNSLTLMKKLGITILDIDLRPLLKTHLENIKQPKGVYDVTYEQCQSRERTQVLLDLANKENAIMIGTGCMSEFALGWMTYGGDHLCMYAINIGLPKTVVKMYAQWFIDKYSKTNKVLSATVKDILNGPVSPELLPIDENGEQHEKTESLIGDYIVQDFFIYHIMQSESSIEELYNMAIKVFPEYSHENILNWLEKFTLRFFTRAYKKNCYGDGLQLFNYSVSPFYFHIPSDIDNTIWQKELDDLKSKYGSDSHF